LVQVKFTSGAKANPDAIRQALAKMSLGNFVIQQYGQPQDNEYLIRVAKAESGLGGLNRLLDTNLTQALGKGNFDIRRIESVGPQVGRDLRRKGILAIFWALIGILLYIVVRFRQCEGAIVLGAAGVFALFHDVFITVGIFSILNKEIDLTALAALLTLAGYSINDTVVVYDRFRENFSQRRRGVLHDSKAYGKIWNDTINETLPRTALTGVATLFVVIVLFIWGGEVIHNFAFALCFGIIIGTYSSIFVAAPMVYEWHTWWERRKKTIQLAPASKYSAKSSPGPASLSKKADLTTAKVANSPKQAAPARKKKRR